jgi:FixJ family two-component response regulator
LRARPCASGLAIEVGDNGAGMDAATLARVFQPFFSTKPGGMGLGLSICHTIVASHGGSISVSSSVDQGTCFQIELPLRQPLVVGANAPVAGPPAAPMTSGDCVFVVDDDEALRRALERQLRAEGYRVQGFANAHAFLDGAPHAEVACIVSDVRMPGLSGLDLQAALARRGNHWPVVFISGHADVPTSVQAMKGGAAAFLPKPFAQAELLAAVADALATSRQRAQARHQHADLLQRQRALTPREADVFALVVQGLLNKQVADRLGIAEGTVKIHRGRVMEKMAAPSVAELVRMAQELATLDGDVAELGLKVPEPM